MAIVHIKRDKILREFFYKNELKILSYNYLINNKMVRKNIRCLLLFEKITKMPRLYKTKIVNYCIITKKPRWVFKKLHYSRQELKKAATTGYLMGFRKASW